MNQGKKTVAPVSRTAKRWDIFCRIVDNYGDIGVCWRLARQLAHEHGLSVRLWVDTPEVAARLIVGLDVSQSHQCIESVEICHWTVPFPDTEAADVVIEAFACELPSNYLASMTHSKPVWINLEYLSAEGWVEDFHLQSSPHPSLPLTKYFFFPGFTPHTGGLLREHGLIAKRDAFQQSPALQAGFWQKLGVNNISAMKLSLFCYPDAPLTDLLHAMASATVPVLCLVPDSGLWSRIGASFGVTDLNRITQGNLTLQRLPFLSQEDYDLLLWACDLNFVRGEDSWIRAIWAARPFIWQPYRQQEDTHLTKQQAFLELYCAGLGSYASQVLRQAYQNWSSSAFPMADWSSLLAHRPALEAHSHRRSAELSAEPDLAAKLVIFCENYS